MHIDKNEALQYLLESGKIDLLQIQTEIEMEKRKELLNKHKFSIYQGQDGKWYTYLTINGKRKKIKKNTEKEVQDIVIDFIKDQEENPTVEEIFTQWNEERFELKEISVNSYDRYKDVFSRHYQEFGKKKIRSLESNDWIYFLKKEKADKNLNKKAVGVLITTIKGITYTAKVRHKLPFNLGDFYDELTIARKKMKFHEAVKEDYQEVFDEEEYSKMLTYLRENLDPTNTAILLMFVTGMRVGEVVALKNEDIEKDVITVRRTESKKKKPDGGHIYFVKDFPKTEKGWRKVVIPKDYRFLLSKIKCLNPFGEYVFLNTRGDRMTTNSIRRRQERICDKLKIFRKSPHKARKTVASIYLDEKLDNNLITSQLGWTDISVGEKHYHRNRKTLERKIDILSNIQELTIENF